MRCIALVALLALAGCASEDGLRRKLDSVIGAPETYLIDYMTEVPSSSYVASDGTRYLRWDWQQADQRCTIEWKVRNARALAYRFRGNACTN